ncbi:sensor histidine kinase [Delftia tsuruhatensis]|uniref:sensor histidine kinase n=1 Tax=Delftia tsuruhatensis TaxID=180282 RepID=UPI001F1D5FCC|nr:histidine kinase [Delftia tsuruhatensis]
MPQASPATAPQAAPGSTLAQHGALTIAACLLITAVLTLAGHGRWDVNLVYSLSIGLISWLTIDLGRWRLTRGQAVPWPGGWRGAVLVVAGIMAGFVLGSLAGNVYQQWADPDATASLVHKLWMPLAVTTIASSVMSLAFFLMGQSRYLKMQAEQALRQAAEARLTLLQAQLEPHMLFNTLANLRVLVGSDPQRAQAMLDHLIAYLRATLGGSRSTEHALEEEFARLRDYLALMSIRMGSRLHYTLELPADLAQVPVPPLLLQPLVENCIRHGLEPKLEGGHVTVRARRIDDTGLELTVADDGMGLDTKESAVPGSRFGTAQLRERLASRYGDGARFDLTPLPEGGTLARITLTHTG